MADVDRAFRLLAGGQQQVHEGGGRFLGIDPLLPEAEQLFELVDHDQQVGARLEHLGLFHRLDQAEAAAVERGEQTGQGAGIVRVVESRRRRRPGRGSRSGCRPGRRIITSQVEPAWVIVPPCSAAIMPARTSEDLPLPEVPTTARKRFVRNSCSSAAVCSSRPKNRWCSSLRNGRRPGNGFGRGESRRFSSVGLLRPPDGRDKVRQQAGPNDVPRPAGPPPSKRS